MNCPKCGTPLADGVNACPTCGAQVAAPPPQYAPPPPPPQVAPPGGIAPVQNSTLAVASLVLGIASWVFLPLIGAIGAIITGHMARSEIRKNPGRLTGDGLALGGLVTGYAHLAVACVALPCLIVTVFGGFAAFMAAVNSGHFPAH